MRRVARAIAADALFAVTDTGSGMTAEFVRERLFRPFDSTKGSKGMGIGAYQVREYVRMLGGQVEVQSSPGHRHAFFDYAAADRTIGYTRRRGRRPRASHAMIMESFMTEDKPKLLIVEDDLGLQKQLKWCFDELRSADRGHAHRGDRAAAPLRAAGGAAGLGLPPDPEGVSEGMATLKEILRIAPHTKVIVVTGNEDRENARQGRRVSAPTTSTRSPSIPTCCG